MIMGHAHKIIENISLKSTAYMSRYYVTKIVLTVCFPGIYDAFCEFSQIFPYYSLFDLLYQFQISVFILSRNTLAKKQYEIRVGLYFDDDGDNDRDDDK
jgi:hypothetical protein